MAVIKQVKLETGGVTTTHDIKDVASGYGSFSATQVMASGATTSLVATIKSRAMNTSTKQFGATTTVNFYSTGGSSSGNEWEASVDGTNLILSSSGGDPDRMIMPDVSLITNITTLCDTLADSGILTKSGSSYTVNCAQFTYRYKTTSFGRLVSVTTLMGGSITSIPACYNTFFDTQSPAAGEEVYTTTTVTCSQPG